MDPLGNQTPMNPGTDPARGAEGESTERGLRQSEGSAHGFLRRLLE